MTIYRRPDDSNDRQSRKQGRHAVRAAIASLVIAAALLVGAAGCAEPASTSPTPGQPTPVSVSVATPQPTSASSPPPQPVVTAPPPAVTISPPAPTATAVPTPSPQPSPATALRDLEKEISADNALAHVTKLAGDIGPRPAGSEGARLAREYIAETLRSYGYDVEQLAFDFPHFADKGSTMNLVEPTNKPLNTYAISASSQADVTGEVVSVGLGRPADYAGKDMSGKIALAKRGQITFREKVEAAQAAGAAGLIIYNSAAGQITGVVPPPADIPVMAMSGSAGGDLAALVERGRTVVHISVKSDYGNNTDYNVATRVAAAEPWIIIGAHFDSVSVGPGANDNASGVGVMLELARLLAKSPLKDHVTFVSFGAEENGLIGSAAFVRSLSADQRASLRGMVNLDMVGEGAPLYLGHKGDTALARRAADAAKAAGITVTLKGIASDSDYASFAAAGIPVYDLAGDLDPYYHSPQDTVDKIEPAILGRSAKVAWQVIEELAVSLN